METVENIDVVKTEKVHHFKCDDCGKYLGNTREHDDGYYVPLGEYEVRFHHIKWYKLEKCLCYDCKVKMNDKIRGSLFELGFIVE